MSMYPAIFQPAQAGSTGNPTEACPKCYGNGFVFVTRGTLLPCDCQQTAQTTRLARLQAARVPPKFHRMPRFRAQTPLLGQIVTQAGSWAVRAPKSAALGFVGVSGIGKTHLAGLVSAHLAVFRSLEWFNWVDLMDALRGGNMSPAEVVAEMRMPEVLVLDDFGAGNKAGSDFAEAVAYGVLNHAVESERQSIIFTSNLAPAAIKSTYGDRVANRINELCAKERGGLLLTWGAA